MNRYALLFAGVLGLAGCGSVDVNTYKDQSPRLDLREYFDGTIDAYGMFQNRQGEVVRRFHVLIEASWDGDVGTLDERFTYADGSTDHRVWTITRHAQGEYSGEAADVVGTARGRARGNALHWEYVLALPVDGKTYEVTLDDWMFLMDEDVMLNRSEMRKFGVRLGEITLSFHKRP